MIDANGIVKVGTVSGVTYGVSIGDLQTVLSAPANDIGGIITDTDVVINECAKYKPERSNKLGVLTLAERQDNYFGLDITPCGPNGNLGSFLSRYPDEWAYLRPRGAGQTPKEWFRLLDFDGYNHAANSFLNPNDQILPSEYIIIAGSSGCTFRIGINTGNSLHTNSIGVGDIKLGGSEGTAFGSLYFGIVFVKDSDNSTKFFTASSVLNNDGYGSEITIPQNQADDALVGIETSVQYTAYVVLSMFQQTDTTHYSFKNTDRIVSLPIIPFSFKARPLSTAQNIAIISRSAVFGERGILTVKFTLKMSATGSAPTTISTVQYIIKAASSNTDTTGTQLATGTVLNLSTTENKSVTWSGRPTQPLWVYIYAYNEANSSVYAEGWAKVRTSGDIPVPVD